MRVFCCLILTSVLLSFIFYPKVFSTNHLPDDNDSLLITYILNQTQNNIFSGQPIHYALFFAPYADTLTYSEPFLTSSLISLPARILWPDHPIAVYNFVLLIALITTPIGCYLLFYELSSSRLISFLSALIFSFSGFRWHYLAHLQMFNIFLLPLSIFFFLKFTKTKQTRYLVTLAVSFVAQFLDSFFGAYLIFFAIAPLAIFQHSKIKLNHIQALILFSALFICFVFSWPYLQLTHQFPEAHRSIRDAAHTSLSINNFPIFYRSVALSLVFIILVLKNVRTKYSLPLVALAIFAFIMALGPVLKFDDHTIKILGQAIPLPYTIFYYLFPGFTAFRTPSRFIILAVLSATSLLVIFVSRLSKIYQTCLLLTILVFSLLENRPPKPSFYINTTSPSVYRQIKVLPPRATILELPIYIYNEPGSKIESLRSLYSLSHRHRRFNGFSGFAPSNWVTLAQEIQNDGLTPPIKSQLTSLGITHVVLANSLFAL